MWKPATVHTSAALTGRVDNSKVEADPKAPAGDTLAFSQSDRRTVLRAWMPWIILTVFVFAWGTASFKNLFDTRPALDPATGVVMMDAQGKPLREANPIFAPSITFEAIHQQIEKVPPVVPTPKKRTRCTSSPG